MDHYAICLYQYFPYGGLQRDCLRLINTLLTRGHQVTCYTGSWQGAQPTHANFNLHLVPPRDSTNHGRCRSFAKYIQQSVSNQQIYAAVIGFNKIPGVDIYYAADDCYLDKILTSKPWWYPWLPRTRYFLQAERQLLAADADTKILFISPTEQQKFIRHYHVAAERMYFLPPQLTIHDQAMNETDISWAADLKKLLLVGSGFRTKGLDRCLHALAWLREHHCPAQLVVIGQDNPRPFIHLAKKLGVGDQVRFVGGRDDVAAWMRNADLLLHPAYHENAGLVLLEAMQAGLGVIATGVCGYAHYIAAANCGCVMATPFVQDDFNATVFQALQNTELRTLWRQNGMTYAQSANWSNNSDALATTVEQITKYQATTWQLSRILRNLPQITHYDLPIISEHPRMSKLYFLTTPAANYYIKIYYKRGKWLRRWLGRSRIKAEWQNLLFFQQHAIPIPEITAFYETGGWFRPYQAALVTKEVTNTISLAALCQHPERVQYLNNASWLQQLMVILAGYVRILHANKFIHTDLKWRNILVSLTTIPVVYLLDCPAGKRKSGHWRHRGIIKDLACLDATAALYLPRTIRLRFYKIYKNIAKLSTQDKNIIAAVINRNN